MFKDSLVLTNASWGIRSMDFVFDGLYLLTLVSLFTVSAISDYGLYLFGFLGILIPTLVYFFWMKKEGIYLYWIAVVSQIFFVSLIIPVSYWNPYILFIISGFGWLVVFLLRKYMSWNIPYFIIFLFFAFIIYSLFPGGKVESETILWYLEKLPNRTAVESIFKSQSHSIWENLSIYVLVFISLAVFRRYSVFIMGILFFSIAYIYFFPKEILGDLPSIISFGSLFFLAYLIPGRNHYAGLWVSLLLAIVILGVGIGMQKFSRWEYPFLSVIILYFMVEPILLKYFLVNRQREQYKL
ncbi:MAG: hypothetical protein JJT78_17100 [Leptospira sp.]|nr:hypothetical protein [Leptospira sp.]